ncbi:PPC domain-containing protein [Lusitaniella coriacea LEGE 07157]|uniref:PPC domain-containing protein n=1 Tax=Lusitaniella coriacea LEGE 07157 TaxID=945747 RepID=A0A8J7E0V5_9CYAN|nr:pre-peptidase C-terminal domain-containing protein [Lusitaniella coriacea]MBE9119015.1 PPC domain-containing protein [Lusitaniella coriacea LEGE 07157]
MSSKQKFIPLVSATVIGFSLVPIAPHWIDTVAAQTPPQPLLQEQGMLEEGDKVLADDDSLYDVHQFEGRAGQSLSISVESEDFDTYLLLSDVNGNVLGESDDIDPENTNSAFTVELTEDGTYNIIINGYEASDRGRYNLTVTPLEIVTSEGTIVTSEGTDDLTAIESAIADTIRQDGYQGQIDVRPYMVSNYALATYAYGEVAGQALLKQENGQWTIVSRDGGSLQDVNMLVELGVPREIAEELAIGPDI